jgi:CHAT domain-containing protein/Tfp pilus assembly protein PilF
MCGAVAWPSAGQLVASGAVAARGIQEQKPDDRSSSEDALAESSPLRMRVFALVKEGKFGEALPLAERVLELSKKVYGDRNLLVTADMTQLANIYVEKGDFARAKPLFERALSIREELQPDSTLVALALNNLSVYYRYEVNYPLAEEYLTSALAIYERVSGVESADAALARNNLSSLYFEMGDFARAEEHALKALSIRRKRFGSEHVNVASSLNNLALVYQAKGNYARAEPAMQEALRIHIKLFGLSHPNVGASLNNLATLHKDKGDFEQAEALYVRARDIYRSVYGGDDNVRVADTLSNLGALYGDIGDYPKAEVVQLSVLGIREKILDPMHPGIALSLSNLGALYISLDKLALAKKMIQRAGEIYEKTLGSEHPDYGGILNQLGNIAQIEGDYERAEELYQRALAIREKALGKDHPDVAGVAVNMAVMYWKKGDESRAVEFLTRANDSRELNLVPILATGSEDQKRLYLQTLASGTDTAISLHTITWPGKLDAARLALTTILRRKGRTLDAMAGQIDALRQRAGKRDRALLDELVKVRTQLATLIMRGPGKMLREQHRELVNRLRAIGEGLEAQIGAQSADLRLQLNEPPVTVERVQHAIPAVATLIEFAVYSPYNLNARTPTQRFGASRYIAYVLSHAGAPRSVDLGDAATIDTAVRNFRVSIRTRSNADPQQAGRELGRLIMHPLRELLGRTQTLLISPDGNLNLIPFAALVDDDGHYLVEKYTVTYLTSGRDLLRLQTQPPSRQPPVVMANPRFDLQESAGPLNARRDLTGSNLQDFQEHFVDLSGTTAEGQEVSKILGVKPLFEEHATEAVLKQLKGPYILHAATHGFFLPSPWDADNKGKGRGQPEYSLSSTSLMGGNPLLRSGLALAGANQLQGGDGEDGVLTALEASGLDLRGTKLVVLSACETGLGEVRNGEGVYGLRRALVLAGAESQVISLWKVNEDATRDLMVRYYKRLTAGEGRSEALRQVQLELLGTKGQCHPYFWAGFIPQGDWKNLKGKEVRSEHEHRVESPCRRAAR